MINVLYFNEKNLQERNNCHDTCNRNCIYEQNHSGTYLCIGKGSGFDPLLVLPSPKDIQTHSNLIVSIQASDKHPFMRNTNSFFLRAYSIKHHTYTCIESKKLEN